LTKERLTYNLSYSLMCQSFFAVYNYTDVAEVGTLNLREWTVRE